MWFSSLSHSGFCSYICSILYLLWSRPIPIQPPLLLCNFAFHHVNIYFSFYSTLCIKYPKKPTNTDYLQIVIVILITTSVNCFLCNVRKLKPVSILLFNMNVTEQVIVLPLLPRNGSRNKLPVSSENPFLCTMELTGVEETAKGSVEMQK